MTTPTQGEHAQTEALRLAHYFDQPLPPEWEVMKAAAAELRRLHAQVAALTAQPAASVENQMHQHLLDMLGAKDHEDAARIIAGHHARELTAQPAAAPQGVAYAELPQHYSAAAELGLDGLFTADDLHDFADRTHALRASHGQAPAGAAQKYDETLVPFLALMRRELHANSSKGDRPGWLSMRPDQCLLEIYWHAAKLSAAVKNGDQALIAEHAADVANMAMMQADIAGLLSLPTAQPAPAETMTLQEVWNAAGGNPGIKPTRDDVLLALKTLDEVCDEVVRAKAPAAGAVAGPVEWTPGPNLFKDWCTQWFGPDADDSYLAKAVYALPPMAQRFAAAPTPAAQADSGVQEDAADPLQGAANWLNDALVNCNVRDIQHHLFIGHNRAKRLHDAALAAKGETQ